MNRTLTMLSCMLLAATLSGCAAPRQRAALDGIEVDVVPTAAATVSRADARPRDGALVVTGTLRRLHEVLIPGHVDVLLCGPEGLLDVRSVAVPGLASKRRGFLEESFQARFEQMPPPGSTIRIQYHARPCGDENAPTCS